jgi:hypothetical protein
MSETEHIKGKLIPTGKTVIEFIGDVKFKTWHSDADDYFMDEYHEKAVEINGEVYIVESINIEPYEDIFNSNKNDDGTIDFEVKYYNGGCGFNEAIEEALGKKS